MAVRTCADWFALVAVVLPLVLVLVGVALAVRLHPILEGERPSRPRPLGVGGGEG